MDKLRNGLLTVGRFVLAAVLCVAVALTVTCVSLRTVFKREAYTEAAATDAMVSALHTEVLEHLESECLFYDLPYDTMQAAISVDTVKTVLNERGSAVYDALSGGTPMPSVTLDSAPFKTAIDSFFDTLPTEERPLDSDASQTIADELTESVSLLMTMGMGDKFLTTAHPLFVRAHRLVDIGAWLWLAVVILTVVSMIPVKSTLRQRAYSTAG